MMCMLAGVVGVVGAVAIALGLLLWRESRIRGKGMREVP